MTPSSTRSIVLAKLDMVEGEVFSCEVDFGEFIVFVNCPLIEQEYRNRAINEFCKKNASYLRLYNEDNNIEVIRIEDRVRLNKFDKDYKHLKNPYKTALLYLKKSVFLLSVLNFFYHPFFFGFITLIELKKPKY